MLSEAVILGQPRERLHLGGAPVAPAAGELGVHVCGGRGAHSRQTPGELADIGDKFGFYGAALATASRLKAKLDRDEELAALQRLDEQARRLDGQVSGPPLPQVVEREIQASHSYSGRSVFGWEPPPAGTGSGLPGP